jgi:hypothetical protein
MSTPLDGFISGGGTSGAPSAPNSRYYGLSTLTWTGPDGRQVRYVQRRLIPQPTTNAALRSYVVVQGDRIDSIAANQIGDPLLYWLICDANAAMDPDDLTAQVGRSIVIALPSAIGGGGVGGQGNSA